MKLTYVICVTLSTGYQFMTVKYCSVRVGLLLCSKYCKMDHQHNVFGTFLFSFYIMKKEHSIENQSLKQINSTFNLGTNNRAPVAISYLVKSKNYFKIYRLFPSQPL